MAKLFTSDYLWLWTVVLCLMLFFPVRHLIWVMSVRNFLRKTGDTPDSDVEKSLKRRSSVTSALLCFVFSVAYVGYLFSGVP